MQDLKLVALLFYKESSDKQPRALPKAESVSLVSLSVTVIPFPDPRHKSLPLAAKVKKSQFIG